MLLLASFGLLFTFLLAIELSHEAKGAPAFLPPFLLLVSPLFYTQSMMAQLDMPAMVLTLLVLLLFIKQEYGWAALAAVVPGARERDRDRRSVRRLSCLATAARISCAQLGSLPRASRLPAGWLCCIAPPDTGLEIRASPTTTSPTL